MRKAFRSNSMRVSEFLSGDHVALQCWGSIVALVILFSLSTTAICADEKKRIGLAAERYEYMEDAADSMKKLRQILSGKEEYDAQKVARIANELKSDLLEASALFANEGDLTNTLALRKIWQEKPAFDKLMDEAVGAIQVLARSQDKAGFAQAVKILGDKCSGCHNIYRKPE